MLASTPSSDFPRISPSFPMSPSYRRQQHLSRMPPPYESPLLTPSKNFGCPKSDLDGLDSCDDFFGSPFKVPVLPQSNRRLLHFQGRSVPQSPDSGTQHTPLFPTSAGKPLLTPIKQSYGTPNRLVLSNNNNNNSTPLLHFSRATPQSTPLRQHSLTPLSIVPSKVTQGMTMDRLGPRKQTPKLHAKGEANVRNQTACLTKLRIDDIEISGDEFEPNASGLQDCEDLNADALFLGERADPSICNDLDRSFEACERLGSPDNRLKKKRVRSRPVSKEFPRSRSPSLSPVLTHATKAPRNSIAFPQSRHRRSPDAESPTRRKTMPAHRRQLATRPRKPVQAPTHARAPLARVDSATMFFGPSVLASSVPRTRSSTTASIDAEAAIRQVANKRSGTLNRHSYAGGVETPWNTMQNRSFLSPPSSPLSAMQAEADLSLTTDDEDMEFESYPFNMSLSFSFNEGSPLKRQASPPALAKKFKGRGSDSGLSDEEDPRRMSVDKDYLGVMPQASSSVGSIYSEDGDGLVTPGVGPPTGSHWPVPAIMGELEDSERNIGEPTNVDAFIIRTLAAGTRQPQETKKMPGTPVKKNKTAYLPGDRPWQSAVAHKVTVFELGPKFSRKSMPSAFASSGSKVEDSSDTEPEESPSTRKDKYLGLGLGLPSIPSFNEGSLSRRWLMRRSSSGALSSGSGDSGSISGTPTRYKNGNKPAFSTRPSLKISPNTSFSRSTSGSSTTSSLNSPSIRKSDVIRGRISRPSTTSRLSELREQEPSRFEQDFTVLDEVGEGEFGKVMKVREKATGEVFAVKKSKRFEGVRHRLRLREEVDILQHLAKANGGRSHPNVLALVNHWEEDEKLFMQTELCELGNFARFLWEYGQSYPQLDESRVWKIIVDLSNGLKFIHDTGVIHLDIKPSNIFITSEGRFKYGDFGMAAFWPHKSPGGFEREGDKLYLAAEVLQGHYGKAADVFSLGMTMLEAAANIVVPPDGESWHSLRHDDFSQVDLEEKPELFNLIQRMMRRDPSRRLSAQDIYDHPIVSRARDIMERTFTEAQRDGSSTFSSSPLASVSSGFLQAILGHSVDDFSVMDLSP